MDPAVYAKDGKDIAKDKGIIVIKVRSFFI
jgi:hypothetical protein